MIYQKFMLSGKEKEKTVFEIFLRRFTLTVLSICTEIGGFKYIEWPRVGCMRVATMYVR